MLDIVTGVPHPDLEQALFQRVQRYKTADPFAALLILVPSTFLRNQLVWRLCVEHDQPLLNVHVMTFFQLAHRLVRENGHDVSPNLRSEFALKECVHQLLRQHHASFPSMMALREIPGAWAALWATLKDLKNGALDPNVALDAVSQSEFAAQTNLESLIRLYKLLLDRKQEFKMYDADDVAVFAVGTGTASQFLEAQINIMYYGFYDLTQVQLDLFKHIAQCYPTTLFFPLIPRHPAFRFAQQFFDQHIVGLVSGPLPGVHAGSKGFAGRRLFLNEPSGMGGSAETPGPDCRVVEVSGAEDEVEFVAKAILQHVQNGQMSYHDVAVVGRTLSDYRHILPRVFAEHGIPIYSTLTRPLAEWPLVKLASQLLDLRNRNFRRESVLDIITSPIFNVEASGCAVQDIQPDRWDGITRELGIQRGMNEWERLQTGATSAGSSPGEHRKDFGETPPQAALVWKIVSHLFEFLRTLPDHASLESFVETAQQVMSYFIDPARSIDDDRHLHGIRGVSPTQYGQSNLDQHEIFNALSQRLQELRALSPMCGTVPYPEFVAMLKRQLEESQVPLHQHDGQDEGVWVLDAMAARGLSFRVLFIIGLTEKVFPRHIREDAFLRDDVRRWINESLGYKVPEQLAGYDEEKLLFFLLVNSAKEFLTVLYQRSNQSGQYQVPSSYLEDLKRCLGSVSPMVIPRRLSQKCLTVNQYDTFRLTPREYRIVSLLKRQLPETNRNYRSEAIPDLLEQGLNALKAQESHQDSLGLYDGVTGFFPPFWSKLQEKGLSPTALETYARCPFQYFTKQVLGVEPWSIPENIHGLQTREVGNLVHEVLTTCFQALADQGYFDKGSKKTIDLRPFVSRRAAPIFETYARSHAVGYPLLWDVQQQALIDVVYQVIQENLRELGEEWAPVMFEESLKSTLPVKLSQGLHQLPITGRVDRIDWSATQHAYRIIDYKYTDSTVRTQSPSGLVVEAIRGLRLQPPLYLKLTEATMRERFDEMPGQETPAQMDCDSVWFYWISHKTSPKGEVLTRVSFPGDAWRTALKTPMEKTINSLVDGIHQGHFFITPGSQCGWCEYAIACHRMHQPSARRARADHTLVTPHRRLRQQKLQVKSKGL